MSEGRGGNLERGGDISEKIKKRIDYAINANCKYLLRDLSGALSEQEVREYLESPVALSEPISDELLFEVLNTATVALNEEAHASGKEETRMKGIETLIDRYIDVEYVILEDEMLEREGFDDLLNEAQIVRFRSMVVAFASKLRREEVHQKMRSVFLFAICRMLPEVPPELLLRLEPSYREFIQNSKNSSHTGRSSLGRVEGAMLKKRTSQKERFESELIRMKERGTDPRFIEKFMQNEPRSEHFKLDANEILELYPDPDDLLADILGTGFVNIMNSYYRAKDEKGAV